ncbi:MAG TPA: DUF4019 domain-containing protein [Thermoanaerobaculia bacterium]|nr:DUF4019 domain-containing protein [Thermoanaerobaculia bacterium]
MRTRTTKPLFVALALALALAGQAAAQGREEIAVTGAREWLALADSGQYGATWDQAGQLFQSSTPREKWEAGLSAARKSYGNVEQRNLKTVVVTENLPKAPEGKYVVTTFETKFVQAPAATAEVVTSFLESSGQWKVVGYNVKPVEGQNGQAGQQQPQQSQQPQQGEQKPPQNN